MTREEYWKEQKRIHEEEAKLLYQKPKSSPCWLCSRIWKDDKRYDCEITHITVDKDNNFYLNLECSYSGMLDWVPIYYCPMCGAELKVENYKWNDKQ